MIKERITPQKLADISPKFRKLSRVIGSLKEIQSNNHDIYESTTKDYIIAIEPRTADGGANLSDLRVLAEIRTLITNLEDVCVPLGRTSPLEADPKITLDRMWVANFDRLASADTIEAALKRLSRTQVEITEVHDQNKKVHRFSLIGGYSIFQNDEFDAKEVYVSVPEWLLSPPEDLP
ncbi:replication initiator protein A [Phaeobacter gallaeciensis]|uniref:replication initiator protein A n=1 Tax=Phaeobacter gallaeciensis TaxID=60890 RepID=UPI00237F0EB4|nr:replication initiator protein A [Phaeobacter gallaeciensis]MDE4063864.1 replication initiator protein A [Phaeobacter gallaeciensis]MDE4126885.1 replication initiator protein A [Phaeobacter gallaeciensis]MDE4131357.1 replication initiator protein A [Phaeobacter gallaeciensis]